MASFTRDIEAYAELTAGTSGQNSYERPRKRDVKLWMRSWNAEILHSVAATSGMRLPRKSRQTL